MCLISRVNTVHFLYYDVKKSHLDLYRRIWKLALLFSHCTSLITCRVFVWLFPADIQSTLNMFREGAVITCSRCLFQVLTP